MTKEIRERLKYYRDTEGIFTDKMFSRAGEYANAVIDVLLDLVDTQAKQIVEGRDLLVSWTYDYVSEENHVITNRCVACNQIVDGWDNGHKEGCEVGAWLKVTG